MKIGIDGSSITPQKVGVGYYTFSMIKALQQLDNQNEYYIFTNKLENLSDLELKDNFHPIEIKSDKVTFLWIIKVVRYLTSHNFDSFFSTANFTFGILYNKTIQVVHDLAPIKYPHFFTKMGGLEYRYQLDLCLQRCKSILTLSKTMREELIDYMPKAENKIVAGSAGVHEWVFRSSTEEERQNVKNKYALPATFFLSVSTLEPRKNHINTILAFDEFCESNLDYHYVIVGKKGWFYEKIFETIDKCHFKNNIHLLGYAPEEELPALYDLSKGVIMLSFYEGLGLSALEAKVRGIPVLVSDIPIFHEAIGEKGEYTDPESPAKIKAGMESLKSQTKREFEKDKEAYSWKVSAQTLLKIL